MCSREIIYLKNKIKFSRKGTVNTGSSVVDPWHFGTDPDPHNWLTDPDPALFVSGFQDANPNKFFPSFYADYFLKEHLLTSDF